VSATRWARATERFTAHTARCLQCGVVLLAPSLLEAVGRYAAHHATFHEGPGPCPECQQGKHPNCDGTTWDYQKDEEGVCPCTH
jgi:uncharacterized protein with PIN domain